MNILKLRKQLVLQFCLTIFLHTMTGLTAASNRIVRTFSGSGATRAVVLGIYKTFDIVCHTGLLFWPRFWLCLISSQ